MTQTGQICVCGHSQDAHQHFRPGSDCGQCGRSTCPAFRSADGGRGLRGALTGLVARLRGGRRTG